jgi:hypothetical protein
MALAQAALDRGSSNQAAYHEQIALRFTEAAQEQEAIDRPFGHPADDADAPRRWSADQRPLPRPLVWLLAVSQRVERMIAAIRQLMSGRQIDRNLGLSSH